MREIYLGGRDVFKGCSLEALILIQNGYLYLEQSV